MSRTAAHLGLRDLVDAFEWARTPLGARQSWPQSLRTITDLCLASRFPIVIYWGPDLVTIYNDAYASILGSKHPWALGKPCREVWDEIWDVIQPMLAGVVHTGSATWSDDLLLLLERRGYPEECYFSFSFTPVRAEDGIVAGVFTAVIETTERVLGARRLLTLRELGQHVAEISVDQACQRAARTLAENPADLPFTCIYLLDADRRRLSLTASSGLASPDSLVPVTVSLEQPAGVVGDWLARAAAGGRAECIDLRDLVTESGAASSLGAPDCAMVVPIARAGQAAPYGVLVAGVSPRRELDDHYRGFYYLLADGLTTVVANARAYEEERARATALTELDRAKTAFFSNVSHEFRTPLTLILGPLEELLQGPLPDPMRAQLDVMRRNGQRLLKLVNVLLDFSRIESGRIEAVYEPTELSALTEELAGVFRSAIEHAGLRLIVDCPPLQEPVYVDREMWEKVVLNLLSNAFKFTLQGQIDVTLRADGHDVRLDIRDTGAGIPADELSHVFERFHRVRGTLARTHEGTGIGLALVKELLTLHGGRIEAESVEGRGTVMTAWIPRGSAHLPPGQIRTSRTLASTVTARRAYADEAARWLPDEADASPEILAPPDGHGNARVASGAGRRQRILCADDNADMRAYLRRLLGTRYDVDTVPDGEAALREARLSVPDLIVSDVMMPRLDGLELLRALRDDDATRQVPVLLLSARAGEEARIDGLISGADDYLAKPFSSRELLARIDARLEIARARTGMRRTERAALVAIDASEAQRRRLSRELHDELGQELTALVLGLKSIGDTMPEDSPIRRDLHCLQTLAVQVSQDMHHVALELRPGTIDDHGLQTALANYVEEWSRRYGIAADYQTVGMAADRLPRDLETTVYRIVQEALTNVRKHADATAVNVILQRDAQELVAIVEDDGRGFDVASRLGESARDGRLGLVGMTERATLVGGTCQIESEPGGTTVFARIPLTPR